LRRNIKKAHWYTDRMEGHRLCLCSFSISIKHLIEKVEVVIAVLFNLVLLIRTGEEENRVGESEHSAYSDRRRRKPSWRVRTQCLFGQGKKKTELVSPNSVLIRTGEEENRVSESEHSAHSDRRRRKPC